MTSRELIDTIRRLDPDGTATVLEECACELRVINPDDVSKIEDCEVGRLPVEEDVEGTVIIFGAWD